MTGDNGLSKSYHLDGGSNFGVWAYMMKNLLQKDGRFRYCLTPPNKNMSEEEKMARQHVMSIINNNAKNNALKLSLPIPWSIQMLDQIEDHIWIW